MQELQTSPVFDYIFLVSGKKLTTNFCSHPTSIWIIPAHPAHRLYLQSKTASI
jgi:hypothetical protein